MEFPDFFKEIVSIRLRDELSLVLGSSDGEIEFTYTEIVKIAGHSCPTVAGAYLMTYKGLKELYSEGEIPLRGEIKVEFRDDKKDNVIGVYANVISSILGSNDEGGFKGIGNKYSRNNLISFNNNIEGLVRFTRLDNNKSIEISYNPNIIPMEDWMKKLFHKLASSSLSESELSKFKKGWQDRVKKIAIDNLNNPNLIKIITK